jgi:hypothetical protein
MKYEALQERVGERFSMLLDARTTKVNEYFPDYTGVRQADRKLLLFVLLHIPFPNPCCLLLTRQAVVDEMLVCGP